MLGVFFGLLLGAVPGLTATMAVGLVLPLTFGMDAALAFPLLVAIYVGGISGGLTSATLLGIPGTPSSVATVFDSYSMARRGEPGKALGIGVTSSTVGGLLSGVALWVLSPLLAKFALRFGAFEFTALFLLTFACATALTGDSRIKGLVSLTFGLLFAFVGSDPITGVERFTFRFPQLSGGLSLLPALIGLFTIPEIIASAGNVEGRRLSVEADFRPLRDFVRTFAYVPKHLFLYLRTAALGIAIGIFPGIGPGLANVLCYSQAKAGSKHPERFGHGAEEGIIGAETGNNAATGGALIPLLTLGIPGDTVTALILSAFMLHGIQPGPLLFQRSEAFVLIIFVAFLVANVAMFLVQALCSKVFIRALSTPMYVLGPVILVLCTVGSFALNHRVFDIWVFLFFGLVGVVFSYFSVPILPLLMGLILGTSLEREFRTAMIVSNGSLRPFIERPISLALLIATVLLIVYLNRLHARAVQQTAAEQHGG